MGLFDDLDMVSNQKSKDADILRAPFGYPGGKSRSIKNILPHLPYREKYIEPFGGSGAVLLARKPSKLEVFNDRYAGVVAFYQCLRDPILFQKLLDWLDLTVHAREEFIFCKEWKVDDPIERAGRWYYMVQSSFGSIGRNWGRQTKRSSMAGKIRRKLAIFPQIHERFLNVQVENQDWEDCLRDYDSKDAVIYCDPPYVDVYRGTYKNEMTIERHRDFVKRIFTLDAHVVVSGYSNPLYEENDWDNRFEWKAFVSIQSIVPSEGNKKSTHDKRGHATEVLWIKEATK